MFDVTTFGESMLRLSVPVGTRMSSARSLDVQVAGTEANVTGALSRLGLSCGWVSALPNTPPGHLIRDVYLSHGINLDAVVWRPDGRLATFYVEFSAPPRPTRVYYDRKQSCFCQMTSDECDWEYLLNTKRIHLSGLTIPLSEHSGKIVKQIIQRAKQKDVAVSFDVNHRHLLWSAQEARKIIQPLLNEIDLLFINERDAVSIFDCTGSYEQILQKLLLCTGAKRIVLTLGENGVAGYDGAQIHHVPAVKVEIVDRIGAGDALVAGCLYGCLHGDFVRGLKAGVVMAGLILSQHGDLLITNEEELHALMNKDGIDIVR